MAYCSGGEPIRESGAGRTVTTRYLTVLGTAGRISTRTRVVNGYALRWDDQLVLFDPGEGFQRQCLLGNVAIGRATAVCITHFHGDHCLGLPGLIRRRALSGCQEPLPIYFPADGLPYFEHLMGTSAYEGDFVEPRPVRGSGVIGAVGRSTLSARPLEHRVPTIGYRLEEPSRTGLSVGGLFDRYIHRPRIGALARTGSIHLADGMVTAEDVGEERSGQSFAFVMDTVPCDGAMTLATGADLLVCEATFLDQDRALAEAGMHLTAAQAATLARQAGARRLVLSHFSSRYADTAGHAREACRIHDDVIVADDLDVIRVPTRSRSDRLRRS